VLVVCGLGGCGFYFGLVFFLMLFRGRCCLFESGFLGVGFSVEVGRGVVFFCDV